MPAFAGKLAEREDQPDAGAGCEEQQHRLETRAIRMGRHTETAGSIGSASEAPSSASSHAAERRRSASSPDCKPATMSTAERFQRRQSRRLGFRPAGQFGSIRIHCVDRDDRI